jgi:hypothetical protein
MRGKKIVSFAKSSPSGFPMKDVVSTYVVPNTGQTPFQQKAMKSGS